MLWFSQLTLTCFTHTCILSCACTRVQFVPEWNTKPIFEPRHFLQKPKQIERCKGDVIQEDSQRQYLVQHCFAMLEPCLNHSKQWCNNGVSLCHGKNHCCSSSHVTPPWWRSYRFPSGGGRGGDSGIFGWGCATGTMEPLASWASSAEFYYPLMEIPPQMPPILW